jgi:hypothetical protein
VAKYAESTTVAPEKSISEIQSTLKRYKANKFGFLDAVDSFTIAFEMQNRRVRFTVPLPRLADFERDGRKVRRSVKQQLAAYDQSRRQRYRALLLVIKSKLESIESGIESIDEAFGAQIVLPSGQTMGEWAKPQIEEAYQTGRMPALLPAGDRA